MSSGEGKALVLIGGDDGFIATSDDRGLRWRQSQLSTQNDVVDIHMADVEFGSAVTKSASSSQIWVTDDGGGTWTFVTPPSAGLLGGAFAGEVIYVLPDRRVFTLHENLLLSTPAPGRSWTVVLTASGSPREPVLLRDLASAGERSVSMWVTGTRGFLEPPGLEVTVDGRVLVTPAVFHDLEPESIHSVGVAERQIHPGSGLVYVFQAWRHGEPREHEFKVTGESLVLTAGFALSSETVEGRGGVRKIRGAGGGLPGCAAAGDVTGLPPGPFLRLCDAEVTVPQLGGLDVEGQMLLSASRMTAILRQGPLRVPADGSLLSIDGAGWLFDYERPPGRSELEVPAQNPDLTILGTTAIPRSTARFRFAETGNVTGTAAIGGRLPVLPGLFEVGPRGGQNEAQVTLTRTGPDLGLEIDGRVHALAAPGGGFIVERDVVFDARTGPFEFVIPKSQVPAIPVDFSVAQVRVRPLARTTAPVITLSRSASGAFSVDLSNLELHLFGEPLLTSASATASTSGLLSFTSTAAEEFTVGPIVLETGGGAGGQIGFRWNVRSGLVGVDLPATTVGLVGIPGWETGVTFPAFSFDSGSSFTFDRRVTLPSDFGFRNLDIGDLANDLGRDIDDDYVRLRRFSDGRMSIRVRAEVPFLGDDLQFRLDADTTGAFNVRFQGGVVISLLTLKENALGALFWLPDSISGSTLLELGSDPAFPFEGELRVTVENAFGEDVELSFGLGLGPSGGRLCLGQVCVP